MPVRDVRSRLTDAAFELFDQQGYEGTTIEAIAARAGVGRTTFFRHFRSKEDAIFPDHAAILSKVEARLRTAHQSSRLLAVSEAAKQVLLHYLDEGDHARSRYALTSSIPALREREIASIHQYQRLFTRTLQSWLGPAPDALLRAELMAACVVTAHNHVLRSWLRRETTTPEQDFDQAMDGVIPRFGVPAAESGTTVVVLRSDRPLESVLPRLQEALALDQH